MTAPRLLPASMHETSAWDEALYAFLVEKGNRSGSRRTVEGYGPDALALLRRLGQDARSGDASCAVSRLLRCLTPGGRCGSREEATTRGPRSGRLDRAEPLAGPILPWTWRFR